MKRVLVTGANGFIGRRLCESLVHRGFCVRGAVRSESGATKLPDRAETIQIGSIGPDTNWSEALQGIDTVVHLAARVHIMKEKADDPLSQFRYVNTAGTENLVLTAVESDIKRFLYASSIKVNGECTRSRSFTENDEPAPEDAYALSKWEAEQTIRQISSESGLEIVVVRPPMVYGPGVKGNFLRLLQWVDMGIPLPLGMVRNRRSLIALDNLVDVLMRCVEHPQAVGQTFLVADGEDLSTPELINRMAKALGRKARLFPFPPLALRLGAKLLGMEDITNRLLGSLVVDSNKVKNLLSWRPPLSVLDGLEKTIRWFRKDQLANDCLGL